MAFLISTKGSFPAPAEDEFILLGWSVDSPVFRELVKFREGGDEFFVLQRGVNITDGEMKILRAEVIFSFHEMTGKIQ